MNINLKTEKKNKRVPNQKKPVSENMLPSLMDGAEHFFYNTDFLELLLQEMVINGFTIGHHILKVDFEKDISFYYSKPCMVLQYMLDVSPSFLCHDEINKFKISNQCFLHYVKNQHQLLHHFSTGRHRIFQIQFPISLFEKIGLQENKYFQNKDFQHGYFEGPVEIKKKIHFIIKQIINQSKKSNTDIFYLNHRCLDLLRRFVKDLLENKKLLQWINQKQPELQKFKEEIDNHISDPMNLRKMLPFIVKKMNVSLYQFGKISIQVFGMTVPAYIKLRRMEKAMELLTTTTTLIGDVGTLVGYDEFSTFSRAFTKHFGNTPSFYRSKK